MRSNFCEVMPLLHLLILSLVQGITEFLPISSSGHLALFHAAYPLSENAEYNDLLIDVAVHVGTLLAVLLYFRGDVASLFRSAVSLLLFFTKSEDNQRGKGSNVASLIVIASLPVIICGFVLYGMYPAWLRDPLVVGWCTVIFGVMLYIADKFGQNEREFDDLRARDALYIGLAQVLALIPGTSRSGITMTMARFLGIKRTDCARFSLLLGIVAISGAGVLGGRDLLQSGDLSAGFDVFAAVVLSFISGYVSIALMMKWLAKASFTPFVVYRLILGIGLLALIYTNVI